ncbi:MAG TPA: hypothetical protein VFS94_03805 [Gemmatimonadales bacterium]|nr:hypothetical protein [Gemmatimonadales bacterium]
MTLALTLPIVVLVTAALRIIPGLAWRFRGMDAGAHLLIRRQIRKHGMRLSMRGWPLLLDERHTYPWGFHWFLALLPEPWLRRCPPLASAISDSLHVLVVALLAAWLAPRILPGLDPGATALVAGLLVATAPALLVVGFGPRAYEVTPRPFGEMLYAAAMASSLWYLQDGHVAAAVAAVLVGGLLLLSSKFAAQVLLFCTPIISLIMGDARLLLLLPLAMGAALVMSGGGYWWVMRAQLAHLRFYRQRLQYEHPVLSTRNRGRDLVRAAGRVLRHPADREARIALIRLAEGHTFLQFLLRNVLWCGVLALLALSVFPAWSGAVRGWQVALIAWAVAPVAPFLLSSLRDFRFLGEAERYPEYGLAPVAVLAAAGLLAVPAALRWWLVAGYVLTLVPAFAYTVSRLRWNSRRLDGDALDALTAWLRTLPAGSVILSLPWHLAFQVMLDLDHRYVAGIDAARWCRDYDRIFTRYPWLITDLDQWRREYGADVVVVDWPALEKAGITYPLDALQLAFQNERFRAYRWAPEAGESAA